MGRKLTVGHVKRFAVKVTETDFTLLEIRAQAGGVTWHEALKILDHRLNKHGPVALAARGVLVEMLAWSPEQWAAANGMTVMQPVTEWTSTRSDDALSTE